MELADYQSGSTEPWTANIVADIAAAVCVADDNPALLETGTFMGYTTENIYRTLFKARYPDAKGCFHTIDSGESSGRGVTFPHDTERLKVHVGDALEFIQNFSGKFNFVFLDDDHTKQHVNLELAALLGSSATKMTKGGNNSAA